MSRGLGDVYKRQAWKWAIDQELMTLDSPVRAIKYPKADEQLAFMTADQIRAAIDGQELTKEEVQDFWALLYLRLEEIDKILAWLRSVQYKTTFTVKPYKSSRSACRTMAFTESIVTLSA